MSGINPRITVIDYGMGNIFNLEKVLKYLGADVVVSSSPQKLLESERAVLPGVGAFGDGMDNLQAKGLIPAIKKYVTSGKPLLGICLGMQLFMTNSEEFGMHNGLDLIKGKVIKFKDSLLTDHRYKIPHIGWGSLKIPYAFDNINKVPWKDTILGSIGEDSFVYFVHSFISVPQDERVVLADSEYADGRFCAALHYKNIYGCQFHPEISGEIGLQILKDFLYGNFN